MAAPPGNRLPLNLGPLHGGSGARVPLNLGINWDDDGPTPPDPVVRGLRASTGLPWSHAALVRRQASRVPWSRIPATRHAARVPWSTPAVTRRALVLAWGSVPRLQRSGTLPWRTRIASSRRSASLPWTSLPVQRRAASMPWRARLARLAAAAAVAWRNPGLTSASRAMPWLARMPARRRDVALRWLSPGLTKRSWRIPWGLGKRIPWIVTPPKPPEPPEPPSPFPPGDRVGLNLGCPVIDVRGLAPLNLGVTACYAVRPTRRTYIVLNSILVVRLPDRLPIEVDAVSIAQSVDAWGATFDLSLCDPAQLALLTPNANGPREIEVTLNGYVWTAIVEAYNSRREFVAGGVTIAGRSRTALLAAPYAPARTKVAPLQRTAAQLVDEELASTGYTADYDTVDWLVPADAWYYDNTTPLDAICSIAAASGAVVQSDPADLIVRIRPRYPASPWNWPDTTPDVVVQDDIVSAINLQVVSQPLFDAVVVTAETAGKGVTARVKRNGEAGTLYAPQAAHQLNSTAAVATEHGRNILGDRGEQASVDLTFPLFAAPLAAGQTGRVQPLDLVEVQEAGGTWHGQCTAVRFDARTDGKALVIEQTITLERHYSDAD